MNLIRHIQQNRPVQTATGLAVTIFSTTVNSSRPIMGVVHTLTHDIPCNWDTNGVHSDLTECDLCPITTTKYAVLTTTRLGPRLSPSLYETETEAEATVTAPQTQTVVQVIV